MMFLLLLPLLPSALGQRSQEVDGDWSPWEAWSPCDAECGGQQIRVRVCNDPRPTNGGLPCPGPQNEIQECNRGNRECPAMIITGGYGLSSVEVYHPGTNTSCFLPSLPETIARHSQDGLVKCGGYDYSDFGRSCHTLNTDTAQWTKTHSLSVKRDGHSSWKRADGSILIIGGGDSENTTELVSDSSGVATPGFTPKYKTWDACDITDTSSVVITGGYDSDSTFAVSRVTRYDDTGLVEDLPSLLTARSQHGCALFTRGTGVKVYVVMGGSGDHFETLSSVETLQLGEDAWRESTALPQPLYGLRAATLDNIIYVTGGEGGEGYGDEIYQLDIKTDSWLVVSRMKTPRAAHGLSVIKYSEVEGLCTEE